MTPRPAPPPDLAGRWLTKFFTDHLAGERAASPRTVASYRDAMKLLLTWFKDAEHIPPEKLRLADIDRPRVLRFLDWLETERVLLGGHPQPAPRGDQVVLPLHRRRAARPPRPGHPSPRDPAEEHPGPGSGAPDRGRGQDAARRTRHRQHTRCQGHRPARPGLRHRRPRPRALRPRRRRHPPLHTDDGDDPREGIQDPLRARDGPDRPARRRLPETPRRRTPASAPTRTRCSADRTTPG